MQCSYIPYVEMKAFILNCAQASISPLLQVGVNLTESNWCGVTHEHAHEVLEEYRGRLGKSISKLSVRPCSVASCSYSVSLPRGGGNPAARSASPRFKSKPGHRLFLPRLSIFILSLSTFPHTAGWSRVRVPIK
jgi:hypothetical protein